jgi:integrase
VSVNTANSAISKNKKARLNGEGTTFFDKKRNKWVASFYDINGKRRTQLFNRQDEADKWRINCVSLRDKGLGTHADNPKQTLEEFLKAWLDYRKPKINWNTYRFYDIAIRTKIVPLIGLEKAAKLRPASIEAAASKLRAEGYSSGSIRSFYSTLSKAYSDGVRLGWVPSNPLDKVERMQLVLSPSLPISSTDTQKLIEIAKKDPHDLARLIAGIRWGLRPGEVAGLRWSDFDFEAKRLSVSRQVQYEKGTGLAYKPTKVKRKLSIPLSEKEVHIFRSYRNFQDFNRVIWMSKSIGGDGVWKGDHEIVFPNKHGNLQNPKSDMIWFHQLCRKASVPNYQRYQMRKRAFTDLLMVTDIASVMAYSGHSQASTLLKHYISPELDSLRAAIEAREKTSNYLSDGREDS